MCASNRSSACASGMPEARESLMGHRRLVADRTSSTTRRQKPARSSCILLLPAAASRLEAHWFLSPLAPGPFPGK